MGKRFAQIGCLGLIACLVAGIFAYPQHKWLLLLPALVVAIFIVVGVGQHFFPPDKTPDEMADEIQKFIEGTGDHWDWDDFICVPVKDQTLDNFRVRCVKIGEEYPAGAMGAWSGPDGIDKLREVVSELRAEGERRRREATNG